MGNIHSGISNYDERFPVGDYGDQMVLRKTKSYRSRQVVTDTWTAEYFIGRASCELALTKINRYGRDEEVSITLHDNSGLPKDYLDLQLELVAEGDDIISKPFNVVGPSSLEKLPVKKTRIPEGGVIKSTSFLYGRDRKGLIVFLMAKTIDDDQQWPYMITVKHYFVSGSSDVGLSVVAKIRNDQGEGGLSVELQKPLTHRSKRSLISMFSDVKRAGGWKADPSSDCAFQSSEDKDKLEVISYHNSGKQNMLSVASTSGFVNGNYNGSLVFGNCRILFDEKFKDRKLKS